ncbi:MAG: metallophosphoesterase [Candidatus Pacearchaeota archaeon]
MKFLHLADCHLGGWHDERLEHLNFKAFELALNLAIEKGVDGILISGDLFDSPMPNLQIAIKVFDKLKEIKKRGIRLYAVAGSHDVAHEVGIINLLAASEIIKNVAFNDHKQEKDINDFIEKIGEEEVLIIGISGKRKAREIEDVKKLKEFLEANKEKLKNKKKILLLHSAVSELCNLPIESISIAELPKGFDYYALGHIHSPSIMKKYCYPGPTFPNNFEELERLNFGSCVLVDLKSDEPKIECFKLKSHEIKTFFFDANNKNPFELNKEILEKIEESEIRQGIITLRLEGTLSEGNIAQIEFSKINDSFPDLIVLKNISKLSSKEYEHEELEISASSIEELEQEIIMKEIRREKLKDGSEKLMFEIILELIKCFDKEKLEGETNSTFEARLLTELRSKEDSLIRSWEKINKMNLAHSQTCNQHNSTANIANAASFASK